MEPLTCGSGRSPSVCEHTELSDSGVLSTGQNRIEQYLPVPTSPDLVPRPLYFLGVLNHQLPSGERCIDSKKKKK